MDAIIAAADREDVATAAAAAPDLFDDIDFDLDNFDFDFDLAADEFCDAYADKSVAGSGVVDGCGGTNWESSSPESAVTDGPDAGEEGALSAYVCELERFLLGNSDDDEAAPCPGGAGAEEDQEEPISVDDCFFGDDLLAAAGGDADEEDEESLGAREDNEPASRKRARLKIKKGTTMMPTCSWGELEVTRTHLAPTQVPALWLPAAPALLCA